MAAHQFTRRHALRIGVAAAATFAILLGSLAGARAAFDSYLVFDFSTIEISSVQWGAPNAANIGSATGGAGAGKVRFHDLTITRTTDAASPKLMQACASGQHFSTVRFVNAGRTIIFSDVMIDSCRKSGGQRDVRTETCTLSYAKWDLAGAPPPRELEMHMTPIAPAPTPTSKT